jgi:hypothetical protein
VSFADTHGRFGAFVDLVQARYPVLSTDADPAWFVGPEHAHNNDNWYRIVAYTLGGVIGPPRGMGSAVSKTDIAVASRKLKTHFQVWCPTHKTAENVLHGVIEAIDYVSGSADNVVGGMSEAWDPGAGRIDAGGALVVLTFDLVLNVLQTDRLVLLEGRAVGAPVTPTPATGLTLIGALDGAELPPVTTTTED